MYQRILQVSIQGQEKIKVPNFFLFSQNDFWLYPSLNKKQLILCSEYIYFGYKTPLALPAMLALLSLDVKMTSLGLISSSTLLSHKKAARIGPHSTLLENISSAKKVRYKPQSTRFKWSRCLSKRLWWLTPAGNGPCRHLGAVFPKTFCSQVRRPVALDQHALWPANGSCREILSGFYKPLELDFSATELFWITSKSTIIKYCIQDIFLLPFLFYFHVPQQELTLCIAAWNLPWNHASNEVTTLCF